MLVGEEEKKKIHEATHDVDEKFQIHSKRKIERIKKNKKVNHWINKKVDSDYFQRISSRISPNSLYLAVKSLSNEQRGMLINNWFGGLLNIQVTTLPSHVAYYLIDKFDEETSSIGLEGETLIIDRKTVYTMLGIPLCNLEFNRLSKCVVDDKQYKEWKL